MNTTAVPTKTTVTTKQAEAVLGFVAEWMGTKGWGTPICPQGRAYNPTRFVMHADDGTDCDDFTTGPAPTGHEAAMRADGPMLNMTWDWPSTPTPTILLEGGPDDWAIECTEYVQGKIRAARLGLFVEPYASYALCVHPA